MTQAITAWWFWGCSVSCFCFCSAGYQIWDPTQANTIPVGCVMPSTRLGSVCFETDSSCGALIARGSSSPAPTRVQTLGWYFSILDGAAGGLTLLSFCVLIHSGHLLRVLVILALVILKMACPKSSCWRGFTGQRHLLLVSAGRAGGELLKNLPPQVFNSASYYQIRSQLWCRPSTRQTLIHMK